MRRPRPRPYWREFLYNATPGTGLPAGFTSRWGTPTSWLVQSSGGSGPPDNKEIKLTIGVTAQYLASLDAAGQHRDVDMVALVKMASVNSGSMTHGGIAVRCSGAAGAENGITMGARSASGTPNVIRVTRVIAGAETLIANITPFTWAANTWYWMRLQAFGTGPTNVKAKIWPHPDPEPEGWPTTNAIEATEAAVAVQGDGWCGLFGRGLEGSTSFGAVSAAMGYPAPLTPTSTVPTGTLKTVTISADRVTPFNAYNAFFAAYGTPLAADKVRFVINSGVEMGSNVKGAGAGAAAFNLGPAASWPGGIEITLEVNGKITGRGGKGGAPDVYALSWGYAGDPGQTAIYTRTPIRIIGTGIISGGGGGGGGGPLIGSSTPSNGGGGGGAGYEPGEGGDYGGIPGTRTTGGGAGPASAGAGGGLGTIGGSGQYPGGAAGKAVDAGGTGLVTFPGPTTPTFNGAVVN